MKHFLLRFTTIVAIGFSVISINACNNKAKDKEVNSKNNNEIVNKEKNIETENNLKKDFVEVLYFHGKQRCATCIAIGKLSKEITTTDFAKEVKNGNLVFREIDLSTKEGKELGNKYEITWSSLIINKHKEGKVKTNNLTKFGFKYARTSPEMFKGGLQKAISELLQ